MVDTHKLKGREHLSIDALQRDEMDSLQEVPIDSADTEYALKEILRKELNSIDVFEFHTSRCATRS